MKLTLLICALPFLLFFSGCSKGDSGSNSPTPPAPTAPASPTSLSASVISPTQINLAWVDNASNESGFTIERRTGAGAYAVIGVSLANTTTFFDLGLSANTAYTYRVIAYNSVGNSVAYTNEVTVTSGGAIIISSAAISSVTSATAVSGGTISNDGGLPITARGIVWNTSPNPTIALSTKTSNGTGIGSFTSNIAGLTASTTYYVRAYATNAGGTGYGNELTFTTLGFPLTDIDGNVYQTLIFCNQTWIQKNLSVTHYRNGDPIPQITDLTQWNSSLIGAWCYLNNDPSTEPVYGRIYNWKAVADPRGLAPNGWHVPSLSDWHKVVKCIDPTADTTISGTQGFVAGGAMKEAGFTHWQSPNVGANNSSGFTGLPAGIRGSIFQYQGVLGGFWSSTDLNPYQIYYFSLSNNTSYSITSTFGPEIGMSVRCVKD